MDLHTRYRKSRMNSIASDTLRNMQSARKALVWRSCEMLT
jgi:hypothetical protein